jgi:L-asparaginase
MTKQILVVFTGGTIGSTATEGTINTNLSTACQLIQLYQQHCPHHHIRFTSIQPLQLSSENLTPSVWTSFITAIEAAHPENYDALIVTHGTDTLSFTACALSYYFHAIKKPLLLVSSNYPLDNPQANGLENFICAVEFVLQVNKAGVFVPYRNPGQIMHIHRGTHLAASLQLSGDFISVQNKHYMTFNYGRFSERNLTTHTPSNAVAVQPIFSEQILLVKPYPGLNYSHFNLGNTVAVLHDLYHSGTACVSQQWGDDYSLIDFIKRCSAQGILVYLAPAIKTEDAYQSTRALLDLGANMLWNMSLEAAYVKLSLAYGNFIDDRQIAEFLMQNRALEIIHWADVPDAIVPSLTCTAQRP